MQRVVLIDLKVKSVLKMQRSFFSQKLEHVPVRLKSVRWGRRHGGGLLPDCSVKHHSHCPDGVQDLEVHLW